MSALVMMGFHQEIKEDENTPWFLVQFRRILFIFSFAADKSLSAFLGRPPRLSQKYCMLQLPVDLEDWQILLEGRELEAALADILTSGWNTSGKISRATSARHYALNAVCSWCSTCMDRANIILVCKGGYSRIVTGYFL